MLKNITDETADTMSYTKVVAKENGYKSHVAACDIKAGVELCEVQGAVMNAPTRYSIQVGMHEHVDVESPICYTNHSCSPNCSFDFGKYPWTLTTIRDVSEGEEISFNYLTTEYKMADGFVCTCGSENCCGTVKGFFNIKNDQKDQLIKIASPIIQALGIDI